MPVNRNPGRVGAIAGVGFVVLNLVGGVVHGSEPSLSASAAAITAFYRQHQSAVIASLLLGALSSLLLLVAGLVLADRLRDFGRRLSGAVVLASFAAGMAASILSGCVEIGVAQTAVHTANPSFVQGAYSAVVTLNTSPYLFLALATLAIFLGGRGVFPAWFLWVNAVVSVLTFLGGIAVAASGFFASNDGGAIVFAGLALYLWALTAGWVLWRNPRIAITVEEVDVDTVSAN
jgi:hypothetical protein